MSNQNSQKPVPTIPPYCNNVHPHSGKKTHNIPYYEQQRNTNLASFDTNYNKALAQYLNDYNKYLIKINKHSDGCHGNNVNDVADFINMPINDGAMPTLPACVTHDKTALDDIQKAYQTVQGSKKDLNNYMTELIQNNANTQQTINQQTIDIVKKSKLLKDKNALINNTIQGIQQKNEILNTRKKQIEMGYGKNIYKRNLMFFLIIVNIFVLIIIFTIILKD